MAGEERGDISKMDLDQRAQELKSLEQMNAEELKASKFLTQRKKDLEAIMEIHGRTSNFQQEELERLQSYLVTLENVNAAEENSYVQEVRKREIAMQTVTIEAQRLKALQEMVERGQEMGDEQKKEYELLKKMEPIIKAKAQAHEAIKRELESLVGYEVQAVEQAVYWQAAMAQGAMSATLHRKALEQMDKLGAKLYGAAKDLVFEYDKLTKEFEKQLQLGPKYTAQIKDTYKELNEFGVTLEGATKAQTSLIKGVTDYTLMSARQQKSMRDSTAIAERLGIQNDTYSAGLQASMKMFGQSADDAIHTQSKLADVARNLGRDQEEFAGAYAKSAGALAKFGDQGVQAFADLNRIAKITGMEMEKVLGIANKFDTFEDAAAMTGKLNAALGGNFVNAMDMMMDTDPASRFESVRDAILDAGLSFDSMSYYQKQFYTESLGLSEVGDLAVMLSGNMDLLTNAADGTAESFVDQKKKAQRLMTMQEAWQAILADNVELFTDIAEIMQTVVKTISSWSSVIGVLIPFMMAYRAITIGLAVAQSFQALSQLAVAGSSKLASRGIWFLAAAIFALTTYMLIASPSKLVLYMIALSASLVLLGWASKKAAPGLLELAIPLGAIAGSIAGVAFSIGAAAAGIGLLALGMSLLFKSIEVEKALALGGLLLAGSALGIMAAVGFGAFALSLGSVGFALLTINEEKLKAIATFATAMEKMESEKLDQVADAIERVAKAMDSIPQNKAIAMTATVDAITAFKATGTGEGGGGGGGRGNYTLKGTIQLDAAATTAFLDGKLGTIVKTKVDEALDES